MAELDCVVIHIERSSGHIVVVCHKADVAYILGHFVSGEVFVKEERNIALAVFGEEAHILAVFKKSEKACIAVSGVVEVKVHVETTVFDSSLGVTPLSYQSSVGIVLVHHF